MTHSSCCSFVSTEVLGKYSEVSPGTPVVSLVDVYVLCVWVWMLWICVGVSVCVYCRCACVCMSEHLCVQELLLAHPSRRNSTEL